MSANHSFAKAQLIIKIDVQILGLLLIYIIFSEFLSLWA